MKRQTSDRRQGAVRPLARGLALLLWPTLLLCAAAREQPASAQTTAAPHESAQTLTDRKPDAPSADVRDKAADADAAAEDADADRAAAPRAARPASPQSWAETASALRRGGAAGLDAPAPPFAVKEKRGDDPKSGEAGDAAAPAAQTDDEFKHWGLSLHAGVSVPHPDFGDLYGPGPNFGVDLEYRFNKYFSLEGIYTFHRFGGERLGPFGPGNVFVEIDDLNLHQFSLNGKVYAAAGNSPFRPFFNFGGGAYKFDPGDTRGGINVGGGLQFDVTETIAVEGAYNFHNIFDAVRDARFSTVQAGVRFRF